MRKKKDLTNGLSLFCLLFIFLFQNLCIFLIQNVEDIENHEEEINSSEFFHPEIITINIFFN